MGKVSILISDGAALQEAINARRGRAMTHTADASEIITAAQQAEATLAKAGLSETGRVGAVAQHLTAGPGANSYRNAVIGSKATLKRAKDGWKLTGYETVSRYPRSPERLNIIISERQREAVVKASLRPFLIKAPASPVPPAVA